MDLQIANPLSIKDIRQQTEIIRKSLKLDNTFYFPVVEFAEVILAQIDNTYNFEVCEDAELTDKYACYDPKNNTMFVSNSVYELALKNHGRHRFTIAHEVGHYFLHRTGVVLARQSSNVKLKPYLDPEWQANTFASELLIPQKLIKGLAADEIARLCCTSGQAAMIAFNKAKKPS